jgi:hypothetical protein
MKDKYIVRQLSCGVQLERWVSLFFFFCKCRGSGNWMQNNTRKCSQMILSPSYNNVRLTWETCGFNKTGPLLTQHAAGWRHFADYSQDALSAGLGMVRGLHGRRILPQVFSHTLQDTEELKARIRQDVCNITKVILRGVTASATDCSSALQIGVLTWWTWFLKINFCSCLSNGITMFLSSSNTHFIHLICFYFIF